MEISFTFFSILVDTAGTRTTSDHVNRDWRPDYCARAFMDGHVPRSVTEINNTMSHYRHRIDHDGLAVFNLCGYRITQATDGMIRLVL
jgi:hypothetical protein